MEEKGEERCTPCRPHPAWQPLFPDIVLSARTGYPLNKAAQKTGRNQGVSGEPVVTLLLPEAAWWEPLEGGGGTERAQRQTFPGSPTWGTGLGGQRWQWRGTGGGESEATPPHPPLRVRDVDLGPGPLGGCGHMPVPETAPSLAAGLERGRLVWSQQEGEERGMVLAATSAPTSPAKVKGSQGTENCCVVPPGGPRRCPLGSAWNGRWRERGWKTSINATGRDLQPGWPPLPQAAPHGAPEAALGSSEQPGREPRGPGVVPSPPGVAVLGGEASLAPASLALPRDGALPFSSPRLQPQNRPSSVPPALSPLGPPPLGSAWMLEEGRGQGGLQMPQPSPHPRPEGLEPEQKVCPEGWTSFQGQSWGLRGDTDLSGGPPAWTGPEERASSLAPRPDPFPQAPAHGPTAPSAQYPGWRQGQYLLAESPRRQETAGQTGSLVRPS